MEVWPTLRTASEGGPYKSKEGSAALPGEELGEGGGGVGGLHEVFADEEGIEACGAEFDEVGAGAEAGFTDRDAFIGNVSDEFEGRFAADFESLQVAIVDTDDACGCGEGAIQFSGSVNFDERLHGEFTAEGDEVAKKLIVESSDDEEKTVGVIGARFPDLPGIKEKILAECRKRGFLAGIAHILERAAKKFRLGEDGEGR